jgi:hypothetical protein
VSDCILNGKKEIVLIYVDDLKAFLEKFISLIWEKILDGVLGGLVGLVDVNTLSWAKHISNSSVAFVYS